MTIDSNLISWFQKCSKIFLFHQKKIRQIERYLDGLLILKTSKDEKSRLQFLLFIVCIRNPEPSRTSWSLLTKSFESGFRSIELSSSKYNFTWEILNCFLIIPNFFLCLPFMLFYNKLFLQLSLFCMQFLPLTFFRLILIFLSWRHIWAELAAGAESK